MVASTRAARLRLLTILQWVAQLLAFVLHRVYAHRQALSVSLARLSRLIPRFPLSWFDTSTADLGRAISANVFACAQQFLSPQRQRAAQATKRRGGNCFDDAREPIHRDKNRAKS